MTLITHPAGSTTPLLWMEYAATSSSSTVVHTTMAGESVVVYGPATPRRVRLALLYDDEVQSRAAETLHLAPGIFTITEDGRTTHGMRYVVVGEVTRQLNPETASVWIVYVDAQEVTP